MKASDTYPHIDALQKWFEKVRDKYDGDIENLAHCASKYMDEIEVLMGEIEDELDERAASDRDNFKREWMGDETPKDE